MKQTALLFIAAAALSMAQAPKGTLTKHTWSNSALYPGTVRDYWVYAPAEYDGQKPAAVMIFQDGNGFANERGPWKAPATFDRLIAEKAMPVTVGIFIDPGVMPARSPNQEARYNRSYEYDGISDRYARFLLEEILPEVAKTYRLSTDANDRAVAGSSSGGIAAFTAAWHRPDAFRRVMSFIGSYVNLRGGNAFPSLVRKTEPKPIRVFLQDGSNDQNIYSGNWWHANNDMASALEYAGYDSTFVTGTEGHNSKHGSAIFADALRWLWRGYPEPIRKPAGKPGAERHYVTEILEPAADWKLVSEGHGFTEGPAVDGAGNFYFVDARRSTIHKVDPSGKVAVFAGNTGGASGLMFGPDRRLYAAGRRGIYAYDAKGAESAVAEGTPANDLAIATDGRIYFADPQSKKVWLIEKSGSRRTVHEGLPFPNGIVLSADESLLLVADMGSRSVRSFQIQPDGSLANGQPFYRLEVPEETGIVPYLSAGSDGMTVDSEGYLYVATRLGIQVCDQPGRVVAIIGKPGTASPSNVAFGGPDGRTLYVTAGDKVFSRRMRRTGVMPWAPVKPPKPRL